MYNWWGPILQMRGEQAGKMLLSTAWQAQCCWYAIGMLWQGSDISATTFCVEVNLHAMTQRCILQYMYCACLRAVAFAAAIAMADCLRHRAFCRGKLLVHHRWHKMQQFQGGLLMFGPEYYESRVSGVGSALAGVLGAELSQLSQTFFGFPLW